MDPWVHKTWQTNLLFLADKPALANGPMGTQNLAVKPTLANGSPHQSKIDALNTATPNLADEPTFAAGLQTA